MRRLFLAVWPPADVVADLAELPRPMVDGIRWARPDQWHLTLRFLGDVDPDAVSARMDRARLPAAEVRLGPAVDRLGSRVVVVPAHGLDELAATVVRVTGDLGRAPDRQGFRGHLTLARLRRGTGCPLVGMPVRAAFRTEEIRLVSSTTGPGGATYDPVARWPTAG